MKKILLLTVLALALAGCGTEDETVFETVGDVEYEQVVMPDPELIYFDLPEGIASEAMAGEDGSTLYNWDDFEVSVETMESGDLNRTIETITGIEAENLTVMGQSWNDMMLYQTVWCTAGEDGIRTGRAVIADDGNYHYCVSITSPEGTDSSEIYAQIVSSFRLGETDSAK